MPNHEVLQRLADTYRMPRPNGCPEQLYEIMLECWKDDEHARPTFETLQWRLEDFFSETGSGYREIDEINN